MVILESPQSFSICNQFEQPLSASDKAGVLPFSPFQIIKPDILLGDGITRAMECLYSQKTYYLLKDERGGIIGDKGQMKLFKACVLVGDTVEIIKGNTVAFSEKVLPFPRRPVLRFRREVGLSFCLSMETHIIPYRLRRSRGLAGSPPLPATHGNTSSKPRPSSTPPSRKRSARRSPRALNPPMPSTKPFSIDSMGAAAGKSPFLNGAKRAGERSISGFCPNHTVIPGN